MASRPKSAPGSPRSRAAEKPDDTSQAPHDAKRDPWVDQQGPLGDAARTRLVNPIVRFLLARAQRFDASQHSFALRDALEVVLGHPDDSLAAANAENDEDKQYAVVDIGCGEGFLGRALFEELSSRKMVYHGFDKREDRITVARRKTIDPNGTVLSYKNYNLLEEIPADLLTNAFPIVADGKETTPCLATCIAVLDQFSPAELRGPAGVLANIRKYLQAQQQLTGGDAIPVLVATLDPDFFVDPVEQTEQGKIIIEYDTGYRKFVPSADHLGPENSQAHEAFLRSSEWYEQEFLDASFVVLDCLRIPWIRLPQSTLTELRGLSGLRSKDHPDPYPCSSGPLIFWLLIARRAGEWLPIKGLKSNPIIEIVKGGTATQEVEVVTYSAEEPVIWPGEMGGDLYIVRTGQFMLLLPGNDPWIFDEGDLIGELEAGDNYISSRFMFPVQAKSDGSSLIRIPKSLAQKLLSKGDNLSKLAYEILRDRFARFNIIAHRTGSKGDLKQVLLDQLAEYHRFDDKIQRTKQVEANKKKLFREFLSREAMAFDGRIARDAKNISDDLISELYKKFKTEPKKRSDDEGDVFVKYWSAYKQVANCARALLLALAEEHNTHKSRSDRVVRCGHQFVCAHLDWLGHKAEPSGTARRSPPKVQITNAFATLRALGLIDYWRHNEFKAEHWQKYWSDTKIDELATKRYVFGITTKYYVFVINDIKGLMAVILNPEYYGRATWNQFASGEATWSASARAYQWEFNVEHSEEFEALFYSAYLRKVLRFLREHHRLESGIPKLSYER